ncbi:Brp/Blh family beta-carotene 15,15'-dioxygenase [Massilia sp. PWRC2]|uniref:Brp/Blh family beta-carotene 15,15'-dioxygenase n=1 Tax=Massilia sp. PWRC2 TaxID=2804626 RepID=UPI003CEA2955
MMLLRAQGLLYCAIGGAVAAAAAAGLAPALDGAAMLVLLAALIFLLGVPHGALDPLFAEELYGVHGRRRWCGFVLAYVGAALLVVLLWRYAPSLFLAGFLLLSALHFSGDPARGSRRTARLLYGGAVIVLPALFHEGEMARLFAFLVMAPMAAAQAGVLHQLSGPWLLATALTAAWQARSNWLSGLEMAVTAALALMAPPLLGFAVFFCAMHSARHMVRTWQYVGADADAAARLGRVALLPMLATLGLGAAAAFYWRAQPLEAALMQWLFVGLAALTVPHMALVEPVRWRDWVRPSAGVG